VREYCSSTIVVVVVIVIVIIIVVVVVVLMQRTCWDEQRRYLFIYLSIHWRLFNNVFSATQTNRITFLLVFIVCVELIQASSI
jgi:hypothetical protein